MSDYRILVVDDERSVLETYRMLLEDAGYRVTTALTSSDARSALQHGVFDLLLCDLSLEGQQSGFDVVEVAARRSTPVASVLVTGYATQDALVRANQRGIPVLPKPIDIDELLSTISQMVRKNNNAQLSQED